MISEKEAEIILRSAIYAYCRQHNIIISEGSQVQASYVYSLDELIEFRESGVADSTKDYITDLTKRLVTGEMATQDLVAFKRIFAYLIDGMGGEIILSSSELVAMPARTIEIIEERDPYQVRIKAVDQ